MGAAPGEKWATGSAPTRMSNRSEPFPEVVATPHLCESFPWGVAQRLRAGARLLLKAALEGRAPRARSVQRLPRARKRPRVPCIPQANAD